MRKIRFYKYHGTGNDFILIDNREQKVVFENPESIAGLCNRRTGIGADGLILLEESGSYDFRMKYYNSDGNESSMCGNGGRCIVAFALFLGLIRDETIFEAVDGIHKAKVIERSEFSTTVSLGMNDVLKYEHSKNTYILNTGSPHVVRFENDVNDTDVVNAGRVIRNSEPYRAAGINVNFVSTDNGNFYIRTYERGVEDETLSCGTGCVAAAIALSLENFSNDSITLNTRGGIVRVDFKRDDGKFTDITLNGPAVRVFEGIITLS